MSLQAVNIQNNYLTTTTLKLSLCQLISYLISAFTYFLAISHNGIGDGMFTAGLRCADDGQEVLQGAYTGVHKQSDAGDAGSTMCDSAGLVKHYTGDLTMKEEQM